MELRSQFGTQTEDGLRILWEDGERVFCQVWRAGDDGSRSPALGVLPAADSPLRAALDRLAHEYELRNELDVGWAARPRALRRDGRRTMLLLEDPGGEPLERLIGSPLEVERFLRLALSIVAALGKAHQSGLVHKDVKPANILVNCADGLTRLTGFGIASRLPRERQTPGPPEVIAGTLAYMAPEQTGRMNRSIDSRSDLYALGVTFYQMLTGVLPFSAAEPMEWVHCHIARMPIAPAERVADIPELLSAIVLKLLAKTAEERYQTAVGVEHDLRRCLGEWERHRRIEPFALGERDRPGWLMIPEKLYGRERKVEALVAAFDRVVAGGAPELVLVSGYSGIGKSSVVHELHKALVPPRGLFASGKFDQVKRGIPYATLAQAFQSLIRPLLGKSDAELLRWREALLEALGPHGRLMIDLIPELTLVIGEQPPVPALSPFEARLRFQSAFQNFVGVFARVNHPLVIFIDDLQWLDPATLTVVEFLLTNPNTRHLLMIGAYRDNEVGPDHPLMRTLAAIRNSGATVHEVVLSPLSVDDLAQLLHDALKSGREEALPLAALVHKKTGGNPFFAGQFLTNLVEEGLVEFDPNSGSWRWSLPHIEAKDSTENVVDLMVRRLQRLSPTAQDALQRLACFGSQADFGTLAKIQSGSEAEVHADFADAVRAGVILSMERNFRFLHDRVQEAAYALIPVESRAERHLRAGRLLLSGMSEQDLADRIFDVVNQLNLGSRLISERDEQQRTAALNLQAAKKAKVSTAYDSACSYLAAAMATLGEQGWRDCYKLTFGVWFERADCEFLSSNFEEAAHWIQQLLHWAQSKVDRAQAYRLRMVLQLVQSDNPRAVQTAIECLQMFGIELPEHPKDENVQAEYGAIWSNLGAQPIRTLIDLPMMEDPEMRAVMNIFSILCLNAYFTDGNLCQTIACRMVSVTQKHGTIESTVTGYAVLSIFLGPIFHRYQDGEEFARLALAVAEKHGFAAQKVGANFIGQMAVLWTRPIEVALACLDQAISSARETGEIVYACYSFEHRLTDLMARGLPLDELWRESVKALEFVQRIKFRHVTDILCSIQGFIRSLRGSAAEADLADEAALEARLDGGIPVVSCFHWILQLQRRFLLGDPDAALACAERAKPLLWSARCHIQFAHYRLYHSLALAAIYSSASPEKQAEVRSELAANLQAFERWAESCPETFDHRRLLLCGELARLEGSEIDAERFYEQAIRSARANGFIHDEALIYELAARFYAGRGFEEIARLYLGSARDCYLRWGAEAKVRRLEETYSHLKEPASARGTAGTITAPVEHLDLATVIRVSQAVSGEIVLQKLLDTLMRHAVQQAGAERGLLIHLQGAEQRIEAEATTRADTVIVQMRNEPVTGEALPEAVLRHVLHTGENVILDDAATQNPFASDAYFHQRQARSILCLPLVNQAKLAGVLYLENNLASHVFAPARIAVLKLLASQAAISLENTRLYRDLAEREAKIRRLVDANIIGIFTWRLEGQGDVAFVEVNDAFLRIVGYDREDLVSGRIRRLDLTPPEWRDRTAQAQAELLMTGTFQPYEKEYLRKDGSRVPVLIGAASFDESGNQGVAFLLDLTDRKRAEAEVRESERRVREVQIELAHANRVVTMGQLTASIAHEVNQPIAATVANAQAGLRWLGADPPNLHEARQSFDRIVRDGDRAGAVVHRIRNLSKKATARDERVEINAAIGEVIELTHSQALKTGVSVRRDLAEGLPPVYGDRVELQQVMLNLILNALEAMNEMREGPRELLITTGKAESDEVLVAVRDSGPGLAPDALERLFEAFYTTKPNGLGLGLSICRSIIEAHGGRLGASANSPRGAVFQFALPPLQTHSDARR